VLVLRSDIIGENLSAVTARLTEQGFEVNAIAGELIPGTDPRVRTVYAVSPTGSLDVGTRIDVTYYVGDFASIPVEIPEPEEPATESPSVSDTVSPEIGDSEEPEGESGSDDSGT
jgi:eukaryotic-like serine/threonine-protein kinase